MRGNVHKLGNLILLGATAAFHIVLATRTFYLSSVNFFVSFVASHFLNSSQWEWGTIIQQHVCAHDKYALSL